MKPSPTPTPLSDVEVDERVEPSDQAKESPNGTKDTSSSRCSVCRSAAKYRCPRCAIRTCSLNCVKTHKAVSGCTGVRDRCGYIALNQFTGIDLQSDYRLLEEAANVVDASVRNKVVKRHRFSSLAPHLVNFQKVAWKQSRIDLQYLPEMFSRRRLNRSSIKKGIPHWTIQVEIPQANVSLVKHQASSATILKDFVDDVLKRLTATERQKACALVNSSLSDLLVYLRAERRPANDERYYQLDSDLSLADNLREKLIIEFPTLCISTRDHSGIFRLVETVEVKLKCDLKLPSFFQEVDESD